MIYPTFRRASTRIYSVVPRTKETVHVLKYRVKGDNGAGWIFKVIVCYRSRKNYRVARTPVPRRRFRRGRKKNHPIFNSPYNGSAYKYYIVTFFFVFLFCHLSSQPSTIYTPRVRHGFLTYNICFLGRANPFSGRRKKTISLSLRRVRPSEIKRAGARASDSVVPNYYSGRAERGGGGCWKCNINTTYIRTYTGRLQSEKYRIRKLSGRSIMRACVYVHAKRGVPKRTNA